MNRFLLLTAFILITMSGKAMADICFALDPGKYSRCVFERAIKDHKYNEGNVKASLFDGSLEKACLKVYGTEENMYEKYRDPAALACALMVCGQNEYFNADKSQHPERFKMCSWFQYMVATERDRVGFRTSLQDLKNYLSLMDLEKSKETALRQYQILPMQNNTVYAGIKYGIFDRLAIERMNLFDVDYLKMSLFADKLQEQDYSYVTSRLNSSCSNVEEYYPQVVEVTPNTMGESSPAANANNQKHDKELDNNICASQGNLLPDDLLGNTLLNNKTLLNKSEQESAKEFIRALLMPVTPRLRSPGEIYESPKAAQRPKGDASTREPVFLLTDAGEVNLTYKFREAMTLTAISEPYRRLLNMKMPVNATQESLSQSDGAKEEELIMPAGITPSEYVASVDEALAMEASRRLGSEQWFAAISTASQAALNRESAVIMATELVIIDKIMHHLDGIALMLAIDTAQLAESLSAQSEQVEQLDSKTLKMLDPVGIFK